MKRLVCAALALSLVGSTAAMADPYGYGNRGGDYSHEDRGEYRRGNNGAGLAIGLGVGLFALAAIAASQNQDRNYDRYDNRGYGNGGGYYSPSFNFEGYGNNYRGYGGGYGNRGEYGRSFGGGHESYSGGGRGLDYREGRGGNFGGRNGGGDVQGGDGRRAMRKNFSQQNQFAPQQDAAPAQQPVFGGGQGGDARRAMRGNFSQENQTAPQQDASPAQQPVFGGGQRGSNLMGGQGGGGRGEAGRAEIVTASPDQNRGGNGFRNNGAGGNVAPAAPSSSWYGFQGRNPADPNNTD